MFVMYAPPLCIFYSFFFPRSISFYFLKYLIFSHLFLACHQLVPCLKIGNSMQIAFQFLPKLHTLLASPDIFSFKMALKIAYMLQQLQAIIVSFTCVCIHTHIYIYTYINEGLKLNGNISNPTVAKNYIKKKPKVNTMNNKLLLGLKIIFIYLIFLPLYTFI